MMEGNAICTATLYETFAMNGVGGLGASQAKANSATFALPTSRRL